MLAYVSTGDPSPYFGYRRLQPVGVTIADKESDSKEVITKSHYYSVMRLSVPYRDNCTNYQSTYGLSHRLNAIIDRDNRKIYRDMKSLSPCKYATMDDAILLDKKIFHNPCSDMIECTEHYANLGCHQTVTLLRLRRRSLIHS